uniref:asparaginase n=1 Tax=Strigamia maritima TaxID=126957 RepID=T1J509_STRMM
MEERSNKFLDPSYLRKNLRRNSNIEELPNERDETKILVLFTGGTIGMKKENDMYQPIANMMEDALRDIPWLNDKEYAKKYFSDQNPPPLVLPYVGENKRVIYTVYEYDPLLDSSNMTINDWIRIATDIQESYQSADGFVILHGTDTMTYTASALSFMLENLGKPVIMTGAQIPIYEPRSDGLNNFLVSLILAGNYPIPEVTLFFNHKLFRGNSTIKINSAEFDAYVDWSSVYRAPNIEKFRVQTVLNPNVAVLRLFPSITIETIRAILRPPVEGVVLQSYGAGNVPSKRKDILLALKNASSSGIIIVNITQCYKGSVQTDYETGKVLKDCGVLCGYDMTTEAALTKLAYVLAKKWPMEKKKKMLQTNLRGELRSSEIISLEQVNFMSTLGQILNISDSQQMNSVKSILFPSLLCDAAKRGDIQNIELLRQFGADISAQNYDDRTPLHIAAAEGHTEVVEQLLKFGASVHLRDRNGKTPLVEAANANQIDVIKLLLKAGAYFLKDSKWVGEMLCSAAATGKLQTLQSFHLAGAWLDQPDYGGNTALQMVGHN